MKDAATCSGGETCVGGTWGRGPCAAVTRETGAPCGAREGQR